MENRKYTIHGPGLTEETKKEVSDFIAGYDDIDFLGPIKGEIQKPAEIEQMILEINQYREEIATELGLSKPIPIRVGQVHLLPPFVFNERYPNSPDSAEGLHENLGHGIFIKYKEYNSPELLKMFLLHEGIHMDSYHAYFTRNQNDNPIDSLSGQTRSGYSTSTPYKERESNYLNGFNEAVVQKITWEKIRIHLIRMKTNMSYENEIAVLDSLIKKIAIRYNEEEAEVWRRIKIGLFTGEMMHLRRINKTYGPKALEVLAMLTDEYGIITEKVQKYFQTDDLKERLKIEEELLSKTK